MDDRNRKLAYNLVNKSCKVKKGEKVYVHYTGFESKELAQLVVKEVNLVGGMPFVHFTDPAIQRETLIACSEEQIKLMGEIDAKEMSEMDCYIGIRGSNNIAELSDVPKDKMEIYDKYYMDVVHHKIRVPKTRWVVLRYPNPSMAQLANKSLESFEEFYYNVCNLDYEKMEHAMESLVAYMNRTDKVTIKGPGTDISFSIKDIPAVPCAGDMNIPDGEVFTAPVKDSVEGVITYNTPSVYQGFTFENVCLKFEKGKIISATANDTKRINDVFDLDAGARYIGEFAIGVNPYILDPMKDILFDEKICGSIHFTPGNCYDDAPNGNESVVHWDLVLIQTTEYGGGEIYFDDVLIRKDGVFVVEELECLNRENLM